MSDVNWFREGVWYNESKNQIALVMKEIDGTILIDKNKYRNHPIFRWKIPIAERLTGEYFFKKSLKGYEFIGEIDFTEIEG